MAVKSQNFRKDPHAKLDYGFDWSDWLESGETISASVWTVPAGISEESSQRGDTLTKIWLSSGTAGETYTIANKVTTSEDRIDERSFDVIVENR